MIRTGLVSILAVQVSGNDVWFTITVRINKVRITGTKSEVVGRNKELEQLILKEMNVLQDQKEKPPPASPKKNELS